LKKTPTLTHWGAYQVTVEGGKLVAVTPVDEDASPSTIGQSLLDTPTHRVRITRPMVRSGYLKSGRPGPTEARGSEPFVAVDFPTAYRLAADALRNVKEIHGNRAIFGGSYGWASAGRFHHAQSQIHRFLTLFGGFTSSRNSYSMGALEVILPRIICSLADLHSRMPSWNEVARNTRIVLAFGGLALKNTQVNVGGVSRHTAAAGMQRCAEAGVRFVSFSPIADDMPSIATPEWVPLRPNSDTAIMLAMAHTLIKESLVDIDFVTKCCTGYDRLRNYILGCEDGCTKTPEWASALSGVPADKIRSIAREIAVNPSLILVSWSVQRGDHGEQPIWMAVALAAMAGSMARPGCGVGIGQNCINSLGHAGAYLPAGALPQGRNPVEAFIPVARISDMLLNPGATFDYDGCSYRYPDIRLVYWAGGNPFHHHQDLGKLVRAWRKPETIIVHEPYWTPLARFADIVLPCATMLERNDIGVGMNDGAIVAMKRAIPPPNGVPSDYAIFSALASHLGFGDAFTERRDEEQWLRWIYARTQERCAARGLSLPSFEDFWSSGIFSVPADPPSHPLCAELRENPEQGRLTTPSGKVELFSETIASFGYDDCPGHPAWIEPVEWLGADLARRFPLHLISNQPKTRLHSQLDFGRTSAEAKVKGREPCELSPAEAQRRGIASGDLVRIYNDRGACYSAAIVNEGLMPGIIKLSTGAWYDPLIGGDPDSICLHGNPNTLTRDAGTSRLAQATTAHSCLVEVEKVDPTTVPVARPHEPPIILESSYVRSNRASDSLRRGHLDLDEGESTAKVRSSD
jgi:biotin/methionine sulfoxide reductase